jgi:hypothetical protein
MPNETENPRTPKPDEPKAAKTPEDKKISHIADEAAAKARKTERRYDRQRTTFPRGGPSGMA